MTDIYIYIYACQRILEQDAKFIKYIHETAYVHKEKTMKQVL